MKAFAQFMTKLLGLCVTFFVTAAIHSAPAAPPGYSFVASVGYSLGWVTSQLDHTAGGVFGFAFIGIFWIWLGSVALLVASLLLGKAVRAVPAAAHGLGRAVGKTSAAFKDGLDGKPRA